MASLSAIVASVIDILDSPYDFMLKRRVEDSVISCRAILIRQEYTKTRQFPSYALYDALIPVSYEDCGCVGAITTEGEFPDIIQLKEQSPFTFVGTDRYNSISYIMPEEIELFQYSEVSSKLSRYTYMNKRPYYFSIGNLEKILHRAPWADPRQLRKYNCDDEYCFNDEDENFFEEHQKSVIVDMVVKEVGRKQTDDHEVQVNGL